MPAHALTFSTIPVDAFTIFAIWACMLFAVVILVVLAALFTFAHGQCRASQTTARAVCEWGAVYSLLSAFAVFVASIFLSFGGRGTISLGRAIFLAAASAVLVYLSPLLLFRPDRRKRQ
jgi:uncharacterized membrane protein YozB (DUF420 family)